MTVHLYNVPESPEHVYKTCNVDTRITPAAGVSGAVRGAISIDRPVVVIEGSYPDGNYCHIPDFGRYYYITDRDLERKDITVLQLQSDPLMSFSGQLTDPVRGPFILVTRCTKQAEPDDPAGYNSLLPDPRLNVLSVAYYREFALPGLDFAYPTGYSSDTPQYILGVIG